MNRSLGSVQQNGHLIVVHGSPHIAHVAIMAQGLLVLLRLNEVINLFLAFLNKIQIVQKGGLNLGLKVQNNAKQPIYNLSNIVKNCKSSKVKYVCHFINSI